MLGYISAGVISLVTFSLILPIHCTDCKVPTDANFAEDPPFWCSISAQINITSGCNVQVEETIVTPWGDGLLSKYVPLQHNQAVKDVSAKRLTNGKLVKVNVTIKSEASANNALLEIAAPNSTAMVTTVLSYALLNGVTVFVGCKGLGNFKDAKSTDMDTVMVVKWSPGGLSVGEIGQIRAGFSLSRSSRVTYLDYGILSPRGFKADTTVETQDIAKPVVVRHTGSAAKRNPAKFMFYFRVRLKDGKMNCPAFRHCLSEDATVNESLKSGKMKMILIIVCSIVGVIIIGILIMLWILFCKRRQKSRDGSSGDLDLNLPTSLQHFAFDTGDEKQTGQWQKWMDGAPPKSQRHHRGSVYATELSPRNQDSPDGPGSRGLQ